MGTRCIHLWGLIGAALLFGLTALCGVAPDWLPSAQAAPGAYHEDERLGYKIRYPKGWNHVAMGADERWISAKYLSKKKTIWTDKETSWDRTHKPVLTVITFIDEVVKKRGIESAEDEEGTLWLSFNNPYKNYQDYLKKTYSGGGWFISDEQEGEVKGVSVTKYEIKVEKLSSTGPMRIVTWVFHTDDVDFACQFEMMEGAYKKLKGEINGCLKSFRSIERSGEALTPVTTGQKVKIQNEDKMTPEERARYRKQTEASLHRKALDALPDDWKGKEMGRFLVLNHGDPKYAKKVVAHAEGIWKWLDKNFGYIGTDEYVRRPILIICKDQDEETARRGTGWSWDSLDIVTHQDKGSGAMSWELEYVNTRIVRIWFRHRNGDLYSAMPYWLDSGLRQVLGTARAKGSRLEFKIDSWERDGLRESAKKGELTPPRELVSLGRSEFYENQNRQKQSAAFIRFLLEAKSKKTRAVLKDYLANLQDVVSETKAEAEKEREAKRSSSPDTPETEEEEEAAFKKRQEDFKAKEAEFMEEVFERTFGSWSEKDWNRIEALYFKSVK